MKIVAIVGSSRIGNTFAMVEAACDAIDNQHTVKLFHLKDSVLNFCDGCLSCDETGLCHFDDAMAEIVRDIKEADGLIIGTPARWSLLSGELKVLFDRLNPLAVPEGLKGKKAVIFAVGQSQKDAGESVGLARDSVAYFCKNAGIDVVGSVLAYGCLEPSDVRVKAREVLARCEKAAFKLADSKG